MESFVGMMGLFMKEILLIIIFREKVNINGQMGRVFRGLG